MLFISLEPRKSVANVLQGHFETFYYCQCCLSCTIIAYQLGQMGIELKEGCLGSGTINQTNEVKGDHPCCRIKSYRIAVNAARSLYHLPEESSEPISRTLNQLVSNYRYRAMIGYTTRVQGCWSLFIIHKYTSTTLRGLSMLFLFTVSWKSQHSILGVCIHFCACTLEEICGVVKGHGIEISFCCMVDMKSDRSM